MASPMTATDMIPAVGHTLTVRLDGLCIEVHVKDVRYVWGKPQLLVTPLAGSGAKWIELSRLVGSTALEARS